MSSQSNSWQSFRRSISMESLPSARHPFKRIVGAITKCLKVYSVPIFLPNVPMFLPLRVSGSAFRWHEIIF
jgi:hypothetical protein